MASAKDIEKRKAVLRARGVPEKFIDNLARRKGYGAASTLYVFFGMAVILAAVIIPIVMEDQVMAFLTPYLYPHALPSLLFFPSGHLSSLVAFGSISIVGITFLVSLALATTRRLPRPIEPFPALAGFAVLLRTLRENETLETVVPDVRLAALSDLPDDTAFLEASRPPRRRANVLALVIFAAVFAAMLVFPAVGAFETKTVDPDAIRQYGLHDTSTYPLQDARAAYVLCYSNPESSPRFDYRIVFPGNIESVWEYRDPIHGLDEAGVLERIDRVDRRLSELHVPVYRMPQSGSPAFDGASCVAKLTRQWHLKSPETLRRLVFG